MACPLGRQPAAAVA